MFTMQRCDTIKAIGFTACPRALLARIGYGSMLMVGSGALQL
jgi:hypothetical protein